MRSNRGPQGIPGQSGVYNQWFSTWQYFLTSTTWRHPFPGTPLTLLILSIGGGAGGGDGTNESPGGGGGSGRVSFNAYPNVLFDQGIIIGAGGLGGGSGSAGSNGGTTSFGSLISLAGGTGGGLGGGTGAPGAGGAGGFGGGGAGTTSLSDAVTAAIGGDGLDGLGGGGGAINAGSGDAIGAPGYSMGSPWNAQPGGHAANAITSWLTWKTAPGGWPNGGSSNASGGIFKKGIGGGGGDATLMYPLLMGRGAGGRGAPIASNSAHDATAGTAGAVIIAIQPF